MGTFEGHIVPGFAFTFLGLWHTFNTIKAYKLQGPSSFRSKTWYPLTSSPSFCFKHFELLLLFSFSLFAISMQVLDYPLFDLSFKLNNLEHATIFLHLAIYVGVALLVELSSQPEMFSGLVGLLASSVFGQELLLLHFHSADHAGPEGHYHLLLQLVVFVSLVSSVAATSSPSSFPVALIRAASVLFQGCWFMDMGFMLWVPKLVAKGCSVRVENGDDMHGAVVCHTEDASLRAMALANLQFSWIVAGILIFTASLCLIPTGKYGDSSVCSEYEKVDTSRCRTLQGLNGAHRCLNQFYP